MILLSKRGTAKSKQHPVLAIFVMPRKGLNWVITVTGLLPGKMPPGRYKPPGYRAVVRATPVSLPAAASPYKGHMGADYRYGHRFVISTVLYSADCFGKRPAIV